MRFARLVMRQFLKNFEIEFITPRWLALVQVTQMGIILTALKSIVVFLTEMGIIRPPAAA